MKSVKKKDKETQKEISGMFSMYITIMGKVAT